MKKILLSIVVPCYNESKLIDKTISSISISLKYNHISNYEIILVDDKSNDGTVTKLIKLKKKIKNIKILLNKSNLGLGGSLKKGYMLSKGEYIMWLPGDNAHPTKDLKKIIKLIKQKNKNIIIPLNNNSSRGTIREIFSKCYIYFLNILFLQNIKYYNGANIYNKKILKKIIRTNLSKSHFFLAEVLLKALRFKNEYYYVDCSVNNQEVSNAIKVSSIYKIIRDIIKFRFKFQ